MTDTTIQTLQTQPSQRQMFVRRFSRHRLAIVSAGLLLVVVLVAAFAEQVMPYDPNATNTAYARGRPQPPSLEYALGTDNYGRDYLSRTISALRVSLFVGMSAVGFQLLIGVTLGAFAGYFGGWVDNLLMRITDIFLALPSFLLLLILAGVLGGSLLALVLAIGALNWMTVARLVRAQILSLR